MKAIAVVLLLMIILPGCVYVRYEDATYFRFGNQSLGGVRVTTTDGTVIEIGSQSADNDAIAAAVTEGVTAALLKFAAPIP